MTPVLTRSNATKTTPRQAQTAGMIDYLREIMLAEPVGRERFHVIFVDAGRRYLADAQLGEGRAAFLKLRMRELFDRALSVNARGLIIAHNHPSGHCRPSQQDIEATDRINSVARALDIELVDHLIITGSAFYSMRAGGLL